MKVCQNIEGYVKLVEYKCKNSEGIKNIEKKNRKKFGSGESKKNKMPEINMKSWIYTLLIKKLWRILDVLKQFYLVNKLNFKQNKKVRVLRKHDKNSAKGKSKA